MDIVLGKAISPAVLAAALESCFPGAVVLVVEDMAEIAGQEAQVYAWLVRARGPSSFPLGMGLSSTELGGHADVEMMILDQGHPFQDSPVARWPVSAEERAPRRSHTYGYAPSSTTADFVGLAPLGPSLAQRARSESCRCVLARHLHRTLRCPVLSTSIGAVKLDEDQSLSVLWSGGEALLVSHGSDLDELEPVEAVRVLDWEELGI